MANLNPKGEDVNGIRLIQQAPPRALFKLNEKVLCYEPDVKKAPVLYDSKVLEVVRKIDNSGCFFVYKIHFQGWKSTWDRYVRENHVLKNTEENKELQARLKSSVLSEKTVKKKKKKEKAPVMVQAPVRKVEENVAEEDEVNLNSDPVPLLLPEQLNIAKELIVVMNEDKKYLQNCMVVKLPARLSVYQILNAYLRYYMKKLLHNYENTERRRRTANDPENSMDKLTRKISCIIEKITLARCVVQDIRLLFDNVLSSWLLYNSERAQHQKFLDGEYKNKVPDARMEEDDDLQIQNIIKNDMPPPPPPPLSPRRKTSGGRSAPLYPANKSFSPCQGASTSASNSNSGPNVPHRIIPPHEIKIEPEDDYEPDRKRSRRVPEKFATSTALGRFANLILGPSGSKSESPVSSTNPYFTCDLGTLCKDPLICRGIHEILDEVYDGKLFTEPTPSDPSYVYGMQHLLRLFAVLPEILSRSYVPKEGVGASVAVINDILHFLATTKTIYNQYEGYNPAVSVCEYDYTKNKFKTVIASPESKNSKSNSSSKLPNSIVESPKSKPSSKSNMAESVSNTKKIKKISAERKVNGTSGARIKKILKPIKREPIYSGAALGARKSLTQEELSNGETLMAASSSPKKDSAYSLRHHVRPSYK